MNDIKKIEGFFVLSFLSLYPYYRLEWHNLGYPGGFRENTFPTWNLLKLLSRHQPQLRGGSGSSCGRLL